MSKRNFILYVCFVESKRQKCKKSSSQVKETKNLTDDIHARLTKKNIQYCEGQRTKLSFHILFLTVVINNSL